MTHSIMLAVPYGKLRADGKTSYKVIADNKDHFVIKGGMCVPKQYIGTPEKRRSRDDDDDDYDDGNYWNE